MELHSDNLHITIGSLPSGALNVSNEVHMIKAALLYGDTVKLCSPTTSLLGMVLSIVGYSAKQRIEFLESIVPVMNRDPTEQLRLTALLQTYKELRRIKHPSGILLVKKKQVERALDKAWEEMRPTFDQLARDTGIHELIPALESGRLTLHTFDMSRGTDAAVEDYFNVVGGAVLNHATYPLFDNQTAGLVDAAIKEGKIIIDRPTTDRAKQIGVAADLFARLPVFPTATVNEVLDIRMELEKPLIRFRKGIIDVSKSATSAVWDKDFPADMEQLVRSVVEPALLEIEEQVHMNSTLRSLVRITSEKIADKDSIASFIGLGLANHFGLPAWIAVATGAASTVYKVWDEFQIKKRESEKNWLYFYYRVGNDLQ